MGSFRRRLMMAYEGGGGGLNPDNAPNGIYVQGLDGFLYTKDDWNMTSDQANGIAVITDNCRFVISPDQPSGRFMWSLNGDKSLVEGVNTFSYGDTSGAKQDFRGYENTNAIVKKYGSSSDYAAGYCSNYVFKSGENGYLGASGELFICYQMKEQISQHLLLISGEDFIGSLYYSSTQVSAQEAWVIDFSFDYFTGNPKDSPFFLVRPFCKL